MDGSSPLARGLPLGLALPDDGARIIPARAGFTLPFVELPGGRRDHPRSRGVYEWVADRGRQRRGSSPLARGLPLAAHGGRPGVRIIPARAGFTWSTRPGLWSPPDHPRSRGVYTIIVRTPYHPDGSSPLARGLQTLVFKRVAKTGIIPARAGFTGSSSAPTPTHFGSSPLARGLLGPHGVTPAAAGIIPARAGFTGN